MSEVQQQAPGSIEGGVTPPAPRNEPRARRTAPRNVRDEQADPNDPMQKMVCITLHATDEVPPGGQFVGVNGKQFWIPPGRKVKVPRYVVEALNNAVKGEPVIDERSRVVGINLVPRLAFTVHLDELDD